MISAFGVDHGVVVSKLSGYDYKNKAGESISATRVGWTESDQPHSAAKFSAESGAKKAGKLRLMQPSTYKKANRQKRAAAGYKAGLESWKAKPGGPATPGKYTEAVWAHRNTKTGAKSYTADAGLDQRPYSGKYRTWSNKNRNKAVETRT